MSLRGSPFRSPAAKSLVLETPKKSPLKGILRTPVKSFTEQDDLSGSCLRSPSMRTPKKSVTWSPSPRKFMSQKQFKVPESPQCANMYLPELITPSKSRQFHGDEFKTPDKLASRIGRISPETQKVSEITEKSKKMRRTLSLPEKAESQSLDIFSVDRLSPPTPEITTPRKGPEPTNRMCTRSGRTPLKSVSTSPYHRREFPLPCSPSPQKGKSVIMKEEPSKPFLRSHSSGYTSAGMSSPSHIGAQHTPNGEPLTTKTVYEENPDSTKVIMEEGSSLDSQQFNTSQCSTTATEESIDIEDASVMKTELTGGIKINISFSRKSSKSSGVFEFTGAPSLPDTATQGRRYGFRQTPDRQQRKAAARLACSPGLPKFSTPRASGTPRHGKVPAEPNPLTYQVELEMQASGLPKLKFKRTDSFNSGEASDHVVKGLAPHVMNAKASRVESPLVHCSKHREPGCMSPSLCTHGTPRKGSVQTYICQSITPTRLSNNSPSPLGVGENMAWTPSPHSRGLSTPENLNSWPRKKRARTDMLAKENPVKGEVDVLEDPELDGVFRLQGAEDFKESRTPVSKYKLGMARMLRFPNEIEWSKSVVQKCYKDAAICEEFSREGEERLLVLGKRRLSLDVVKTEYVSLCK